MSHKKQTQQQLNKNTALMILMIPFLLIGYLGMNGSLGYVFSDIAISPVYTLNAILHLMEGEITPELIVQVVSAIICMLWYVVIKYGLTQLSFPPKGQESNGITATAMRILSVANHPIVTILVFVLMLIGFGAIVGDGIVTSPLGSLSSAEAIVLSFGLGVGVSLWIGFVMVVGIAISQIFGASKLGRFYEPIMIVWFVSNAAFAIFMIFKAPMILQALNPFLGLELIFTNPVMGQQALRLIMISEIFLAATGGECLPGDQANFGRNAIRRALIIAIPCLILTYLGQGAGLLLNPHGDAFLGIFPEGIDKVMAVFSVLPIFISGNSIFATVMNGYYNLMEDGYAPRIPFKINGHDTFSYPLCALLLVGQLVVLFVFQESGKLTGLYGLSVNVAGLDSTLLGLIYMLAFLKYGYLRSLVLSLPFLIVEVRLLQANIAKMQHAMEESGVGVFITLGVAAATILYLVVYNWDKLINIPNIGKSQPEMSGAMSVTTNIFNDPAFQMLPADDPQDQS